jgi:uncharacterized protein (TIGR02268 family)
LFLPPVKVVPLLLPLLALSARAQPASADGVPRPHPPEPVEVAAAVEVRLAPGRPVTLLFEAELDTVAIRRASRELGLERVAMAEDMMTLVLPEGLAEGARLRLPVRFADGQQPEGLSLVLIVDAANARPHVQVPRRARGPQALPKGATVAAAVRESEWEGAWGGTGGLTDLVATGVLSKGRGVRAIEVPVAQWENTGAVSVTQSNLYVGGGRMAVEVAVAVKGVPTTTGSLAWTPGDVKLTRNGTPVPLWSVRWLEGPLAKPHDRARLVVEWEAPEADPSLQARPPVYSLEVPGQGGRGTLRAACLSAQMCGPGRKP